VTPAPANLNAPSRRTILKASAAAALLPLTRTATAQDHFPKTVAQYLATLTRPDGGYAWPDQPHSHLTPTHAAIGCHQLLNLAPPNKTSLAAYVRTHHPFHIKKLERDLRCFEFQQIQSLLWLGQDASSFRETVTRWTQPTAYPRQYEQHGYPVFEYELTAFVCRELLGRSLTDLSPRFIDYLTARRRENGSFNNTPAADGGDGHVVNMFWGLQALRALGRSDELKQPTIAWLRACQLPSGGFTHQPKPDIGGIEDVAYTRAAVRSLALLGATPSARDACITWLHSLQNPDGGFADRPDWASNPVATYYALDSLHALNALDTLQAPRQAPAARLTRLLPDNLRVYSIQIEAHGQGSPAEAVDLAHHLRIHLWGAKNAKPAWIQRAQAIADARKVPVRFFTANEEYGTWLHVPGMGTYSHTSDVITPAGADIGPSLANQGPVSWTQFRDRRLAPLQNAGGRLIWQFGENEQLTRMLLDDSLQRGGFAAISTFHFGNPDFTNSEPFLQHYRGQIPFVALQDAHGPEPWWFADMTTGFRTLFLAPEPTWEHWLAALKNNWTAAVRHDTVSAFKTWIHTASTPVLEFVKRHEAQWKWWENPEIRRPLISLVALTPNDTLEAGHPATGVTLRVRLAWENTTQGLPKRPLSELTSLTLDGAPVEPKLVERKQPNGARADHYHLFHIANPPAGKHTTTATARLLVDNSPHSRTIEFQM
jgi:prenyltransferase beta subunit